MFHPGRSHECCPVCVTGGLLPCGRYLLGWEFRREQRANKTTNITFYTFTPSGQHTLAFYTKLALPLLLASLLELHCSRSLKLVSLHHRWMKPLVMVVSVRQVCSEAEVVSQPLAALALSLDIQY